MKWPSRVSMLKIGVAIVLLGLLFWHVDQEQLWAMLRGADPVYLWLCLLFSLLMVAVSCWKWWFFLRLQQAPIPFARLYRWYFIGYFYSNFLPSNVGGDVVRACYVRAHTQSGSIGIISIFAERFTGIIVLLLLAGSLPFLLQGPWREPAVWVVAVAALGLCVALLLVVVWGHAVLNTRRAQWGVARLQSLLKADQPNTPGHRVWTRTTDRLQRVQDQGTNLYHAFQRQPRALIQVAALTLLFYSLTLVNVVLAYRTFGVWPPSLAVASVLPTSLLVGMVPVSLGNLGIVEGSYVYYFGLVGMSAELTLLVGLFLRFKMLMLGLIGWLVQLGCSTAQGEYEEKNTTIH